MHHTKLTISYLRCSWGFRSKLNFTEYMKNELNNIPEGHIWNVVHALCAFHLSFRKSHPTFSLIVRSSCSLLGYYIPSMWLNFRIRWAICLLIKTCMWTISSGWHWCHQFMTPIHVALTYTIRPLRFIMIIWYVSKNVRQDGSNHSTSVFWM